MVEAVEGAFLASVLRNFKQCSLVKFQTNLQALSNIAKSCVGICFEMEAWMWCFAIVFNEISSL